MSARERLLQLVRRYGPRTVKGVMKRIIDNAETAFLAKLERLPDGAWSDRTYVEACRPGGPAHPPGPDQGHQEGRPADLRQRRHRAPRTAP